MADAKAPGGEAMPVDTPEYGCVSDLADQQAETATPEIKEAKPAAKPAPENVKE